MKKRLLAVLLTGVMCAGMLAGCGGNDAGKGSGDVPLQESGTGQGSSSADGSGGAEADYSEKLKLTAWVHTDDNEHGYLLDTNENPVVAYIMNKFNVDFEWQLPPLGSEAEQMNLMIGSGDYTDIFDTSYCQQTKEELYADGVIYDLTPYAEQYMPNYVAYLKEHEAVAKQVYSEDGRLLFVANIENEPAISWGGLVYDRNILVKMTDDNIQFPSGNEEPKTVADWEYMLELMKQYFEDSGLAEYACLILPYNGYFAGDLVNGFGASGTTYLKDGVVQHGMYEKAFYNYLTKMKEWYEKGYIYQDFASRSSDPFYFPNTALTYGGAAGIFYGLVGQLGGNMNNPEYGWEFDYRALTAPIDEENGAELLPGNGMVANSMSNAVQGGGWVVSTACSEEKLIRWLQICDWLFTEEGSMMKSYGLTKEQAEGDPAYERNGLKDGAYWFDENGEFVYNPVLAPNSGNNAGMEQEIRIARWPGLYNRAYYNASNDPAILEAHEIWISNGYSACIPTGVKLTPEESQLLAPLNTAINDYVDSMIPQFIMGKEPLTEESFEAFVQQMKALGSDTVVETWQAAYDRYMK